MKASFLKTKIKSLRRYDLMKTIIDILLPDIDDIGDYDSKMFYRKGDKVYYYNKLTGVSKIIEATIDSGPSVEPLSSNWSTVGGSSLSNSEILKKIERNKNNNLMYEGTCLNNVHVSENEPSMNENDLWFKIGNVDNTDNPSPPSYIEPEVLIKNMTIQDGQPTNNDYLWGDIEEVSPSV